MQMREERGKEGGRAGKPMEERAEWKEEEGGRREREEEREDKEKKEE